MQVTVKDSPGARNQIHKPFALCRFLSKIAPVSSYFGSILIRIESAVCGREGRDHAGSSRLEHFTCASVVKIDRSPDLAKKHQYCDLSQCVRLIFKIS